MPKVGLWIIGARGSVAVTTAVGISAIVRGLSEPTGILTETEPFKGVVDLPLSDIVMGGHDITQRPLRATAEEIEETSGIFSPALLKCVAGQLDVIDARVRPGTVINAGEQIGRVVSQDAGVNAAETAREAVEHVAADLREFRSANDLEHVVVVNLASTEPPCPAARTLSLAEFEKALDAPAGAGPDLPGSSLYAWCALNEGCAYANFTPSPGSSIRALVELADARGLPHAGRDGKTGETLMKSVLGSLFMFRRLKVMSWEGYNILGNQDGAVLEDPTHKASKVFAKDSILPSVLGYRPHTHVAIDYVPSLGEWKTAWDFIHFRGFLGVKMALHFLWEGCDSILAAPLVIDLARFMTLALRRGEKGIVRPLAPFFKDPLGVRNQAMHEQFRALTAWATGEDADCASRLLDSGD